MLADPLLYEALEKSALWQLNKDKAKEMGPKNKAGPQAPLDNLV